MSSTRARRFPLKLNRWWVKINIYARDLIDWG
jgi:hypothetical protein